MKRPIKFKRVFQHSETGRICMKLWGNLNHKYEDCDDFSSFISPAQLSSYYPVADLQFTELKNQGGKEIFEGDILRTLHYRTESEVRYLFHKVVYDNKRATFNAINLLNKDDLLTTNRNCFLYVALKDETCEVVGNIFENPEHLKP